MSFQIIQDQIDCLNEPFRVGLVDFFREEDIQTSIALFSLRLGSQIVDEGIKAPETTLGALFDDSNDENWGEIETRWANILRKYQGEMNYILTRSAELLFDIEKDDITPEDEKEWDELGLQHDSLVGRLLEEVNADINGIVQGLKEITELKF